LIAVDRVAPRVHPVVQMYGPGALATPRGIVAVAGRIAETVRAGAAVCVVVSAMGETTRNLLALAARVSSDPEPREVDMLLATGAQISIALLTMALHDAGVESVSLTGEQAGIITDGRHGAARIVEIRPDRVTEALALGVCPIVAGSQGVSQGLDVTTLGDPGLDATAIALARVLSADLWELCNTSDGDGDSGEDLVASARTDFRRTTRSAT
jgi:aspartate kinase